MVLVKPFRALRPYPAFAALVAAPPYDVSSVDEALEFARKNPLCFLHTEKSEIDLPPEERTSMEKVVSRAREHLDYLRREQILFHDPTPSYYLYGQRMGDHRQYGVVAVASARAYEQGIIKRHELTRADKEEERTLHVERVGAHTGPVLLAYKSTGQLDGIVHRIVTETIPEYTFTSPDRVIHQVWKVTRAEDTDEITRYFAGVDALYIADGHHRAAAAATVAHNRRHSGPAPSSEAHYEYFLAVIFPHNELMILPYHRVVRDLHGLTEEQFLREIGIHFQITRDPRAREPNHPHEFGMYMNRRWYRLSAKEGTIDEGDPISSLDVSILQDRLLAPLLGIADPRTNDRIDFIGGIRGPEALEQLVDTGKFKVAFSLYPVPIEKLMAIADRGAVMPPKSTWFEPKLLSGLFIHLID